MHHVFAPARFSMVLLILLCTVFAGCATGHDPRDPLEPVNRSIYKFNEAVDKAVVKPVAVGYTKAVPLPVRSGVTNFFSNFRDVTVAINNLLQGKFSSAASDLGRIAVNSTVGILGVFDVASRLGLEKHNEDFGQTLGHWGVGDGAYLMLPFLGPSTTRDAVGWVGDYFTDPEFYLFTGSPENWIAFGTRFVNLRANLLDSEELFDAAAVDRYAFLRDAYLQRRHTLIEDGKVDTLRPEVHRHKTFKEMEEEFDQDEPPPKP